MQSHYTDFQRKTINALIVTEHSIAYERYIRLPSNKDKQTTQKSSYNDTKASVNI